jgi:hypothetical protein
MIINTTRGGHRHKHGQGRGCGHEHEHGGFQRDWMSRLSDLNLSHEHEPAWTMDRDCDACRYERCFHLGFPNK